MSHVLLVCCISFFLLGRCSALRVNFISDVHYDPLYGQPGGYGHCGPTSPPLGEPGCDTSPELLTSLCADMTAQLPAHTFMLGDMQRHGFSYKHSSPQDTIAVVGSRVAGVAPRSPTGGPAVVAALGNNDVVPDYYFDVAMGVQTALRETTAILRASGLMEENEAQQFSKCGFYVRRLSENLRVIVLHTLIWCHKIEPPIPAEETDPCGQFEFLTTELESARKENSKVIIAGHVPPHPNIWHILREGGLNSVESDMYWKSMFQQRYNRLMKEYSDTIIVQLYGHTHLFFYQALAGGVPSLVIPAVTPLFGNSPSYFTAQLEDDTWRLLNVTQRFLQNTTWTTGLRIEDVIGDLSDISSLWRSANMLRHNDTLWSQYLTLRAGGVENETLFPHMKCDRWCRRITVCAMRSDTWDDINVCLQKERYFSYVLLFWIALFIIFLFVPLVICIVLFFGFRSKTDSVVQHGDTEMIDTVPPPSFSVAEGPELEDSQLLE